MKETNLFDFREKPGQLIDAYDDGKERKGFFTDTSICIGCKACEVACKEWNQVPMKGDLELLESSYDNTGGLGANTWRHVAFVEQDQDQIKEARESGARLVSLGMPSFGSPETKRNQTPSTLGCLSLVPRVSALKKKSTTHRTPILQSSAGS